MYAETDFLLALIKEDDWLSERAEEVYEQNKDSIWTSEHTLIELMVVAYREDKDSLKTVSNAQELVEIRGDADDILAAANYVQNEGMTPFDAVHLVKSKNDTIISSDSSYDSFSERMKLEES
ncbi:MAG: PIN domain-containing protein [Halobacteriales archaeon]|nr:PIN domain-containing protein [Halobacteriales archaeon]